MRIAGFDTECESENSMWQMALSLLIVNAAEPLGTSRFRAVTLEPGQRKQFRVASLEKVTAASGRCVEEGVDIEEPESFWLEASCSGVRTTFVWKKDGSRVQVMACAEDAKRSPALLKLRQKTQMALKAFKTMTACVRGSKVELWGWALNAKELEQAQTVAQRSDGQVESHVELLAEEER
jgi:hypothetical protein